MKSEPTLVPEQEGATNPTADVIHCSVCGSSCDVSDVRKCSLTNALLHEYRKLQVSLFMAHN